MPDAHITDTDRYREILEWVRSIDMEGEPFGLPDQKAFSLMVAERPGAYNGYEPHEEQLHDIPEEYELAYMQVKLERLKAGR